MSRRKYFIIGATAIIILSSLDLITTSILTPDLSEEANPLVRWYGFGWIELILKNVAVILFVSIPFYFHSLVFNTPVYDQKTSPRQFIKDYFFSNHSKLLISVGKALFNLLGYYLFWWYFITKFTAVAHNTLHIFNAPFYDMSFHEQIDIMDRIRFWFLLIMMLVFLIRFASKAISCKAQPVTLARFRPIFFFIFISLYISFRLFMIYAKPIHVVELATAIDPDITLVNIGEADRGTIADYITIIQSHRPAVIGVDIFFMNEKDQFGDTALQQALSSSRNVILACRVDKEKGIEGSHPKFSKRAESGIVSFKDIGEFTSRITPVWRIMDSVYEDFSLKVLKKWKPGFEIDIKPNRSIPVKFARQLNRFINVDGDYLREIDPAIITNKVVLLGYSGPSNEDTYYTPFELVGERSSTYGVVILANAIRTLMKYEKK